MPTEKTYALSSSMAAFISKTLSFASPNMAIVVQREAYSRMARAFTPPRPAGVSSQDGLIGSLGQHRPMRRYQPAGPQPSSGWPAVLYLHGGSFSLGDLDSHDFITAALCASLGAVVIALDYRLAPEYPYPAAVEDSQNAWDNIQADAQRLQIDPRRIAVVGDSAGGNLAATLCQFLRDQGGIQPCGQALVYPSLTVDEELPSHVEHANAPLLSRAESLASRFYYRPNPQMAPLSATSFTGLPPTFVAVAEWDPLRDEGICYVSRIEAAGGQAHLDIGQGLVHGCLRAIGACPEVDRLYAALVTQLQHMLEMPGTMSSPARLTH